MPEIVNDPPVHLGKMVGLAIGTLIVLYFVLGVLLPHLGLRPAGETPTPTTPTPTETPIPLRTAIVVERTITETTTVTATVTETLVLEPRVYIVEPLPESTRVRVKVLDHEVRLYILNLGNETLRLRVYAVLRNPFTGFETLSSAVVDDLEPGVERAVPLKKTPLDTVAVVIIIRD